MKKMTRNLYGLTAIAGFAALVHPAYSVELITSDGAWSKTAFITPSNGGAQTNSNTGGAFIGYGGAHFRSNAENQSMNMQATVTNIMPVYTEGYTYNYKASSAAAIANHSTDQVVHLLANGNTVTASRVAGPNNTGTYGSNDRPTITGSYAVAAGDSLIGQTVGVRISSAGAQCRFAADGSSGLSAVLTDHLGFNGDGVIYTTSFDDNGSGGWIATDNVLDMVLSGVGVSAGYISMNSNDAGAKNTATLASAEDTFRGDGTYTITFDAKKHIDSDPTQNDLSITLGSFTTNVTVTTTRAPYTVEVDADAAGITGELLSIVIEPAGTPASSVDQFRLYDLTISVPPPSVVPFALPADPSNLIANGGFTEVTNTELGSNTGAPTSFNINDSFGDFSAFWEHTADLTGWTPYYDDPNDLTTHIGTKHADDGGVPILDGTFYLDTLVNTSGGVITLNSSEDYRNGLMQADILNGVTVKAGATYQLSINAYCANPNTNQSSATFTAALTGNSTDVAAAIGSPIVIDADTLPTSGGTYQTATISGADMLAASGAPINVIFEQVNGQPIDGYPTSSANPTDSAQVSQIRIADISLILNIPAYDLNKDGAVDVDDVTLLNSYLDGSVDGGDDAATRQSVLIAFGFTPAEALDYMNLTGYDFNGDGTYDAADITSYQGLAGLVAEDVVIESISVNGATVTVEVGGLVVGKQYYLMRDGDLSAAPEFDEVADSVTAASTEETLTDSSAPAGEAFYRVTD